MHDELADIKSRIRRMERTQYAILSLLRLIYASASRANQAIIDKLAAEWEKQNDEMEAALKSNETAG